MKQQPKKGRAQREPRPQWDAPHMKALRQIKRQIKAREELLDAKA